MAALKTENSDSKRILDTVQANGNNCDLVFCKTCKSPTL